MGQTSLPGPQPALPAVWLWVTSPLWVPASSPAPMVNVVPSGGSGE